MFGYDAALDGGTRMGGDTIRVTGGAGPDSPLVVYGDTSQDGAWYSGHPYDIKGGEFGPKPFDPFATLPDGENEDDECGVPAGQPVLVRGQRRDRRERPLRGRRRCRPSASPRTAARATTRFIGSGAGDHLAGGSGDDTISAGAASTTSTATPASTSTC